MLKESNNSKFRHFLKASYYFVNEAGFNPARTLRSLAGLPVYLRQLFVFAFSSKNTYKLSLYPCLSDRYSDAGSFPRHYFHQDLWASKIVFRNNPDHHVDVGSRVDGFVAHLLTFREVEVLDVRPLKSDIEGMSFRQADLMQIDSIPSNIADSISCLHALEHFGLGRYGDPLDPEGHIKGLKALTKALRVGGHLLLSVPIGKERIEFNAHRVFSPLTILNLLKDNYELLSFSYVDDENKYYSSVDVNSLPGLVYGCGMFELKKTSE
jgi:Caenorhabditis protein of unknown function, DUF268